MTQESRPLASIALFGKPHGVWPAAAVLQKQLPERISLTIVEDNAGAGHRTACLLPAKSPLHDLLDIRLEELAEQCHGRYSLALEWQGWPNESSRFFSAPSGGLPLIEGLELHHILLRAARMHGKPSDLGHLYEPFRFAARAASAGKFAWPDTSGLSPAAMLGPAAHVESSAYAELLKGKVDLGRVIVHHAVPHEVRQEKDGGGIRSVKLDNGISIAADFFVDVSGQLSDLVGEKLDSGRQSLAPLLPFDRVISGARSAKSGSLASHPVIRALPGGVLSEIPLADKIASEFLFVSSLVDEEGAKNAIGIDKKSAAFEAFFLDRPWTENLVRIGEAATRLGSQFDSDQRLLAEEIILLASHLPARNRMQAEAATYNAQQAARCEEIRDFALLPFTLSRSDGDFLDIARSGEIPESLKLRIDQFKSRGRFVPYDHELIDRQQWLEMLIGFGLVPARHDPLADALDMHKIQPALKRLADSFNRAIAGMDDHR